MECLVIFTIPDLDYVWVLYDSSTTTKQREREFWVFPVESCNETILLGTYFI